mmetsp:Transcript_27295/g.84169  ORF Transcript_27295/g.84169 Transcript_27295/m.84169 type:complete len:206 (-) Transcript_27295:900-1517(-)
METMRRRGRFRSKWCSTAPVMSVKNAMNDRMMHVSCLSDGGGWWTTSGPRGVGGPSMRPSSECRSSSRRGRNDDGSGRTICAAFGLRLTVDIMARRRDARAVAASRRCRTAGGGGGRAVGLGARHPEKKTKLRLADRPSDSRSGDATRSPSARGRSLTPYRPRSTQRASERRKRWRRTRSSTRSPTSSRRLGATTWASSRWPRSC